MASDNESYFGRCRCCLNYGYLKHMWTQYQTNQNTETFGQILVDCFALSWVTSEDTLSEDHICEDCINRLQDASSFKQMVLDSQNQIFSEDGGLQVKLERVDEDEEDNMSQVSGEEVFMVYNEEESDSHLTNDSNYVDESMHTDEDSQNIENADEKKDVDYQEIEYLEDVDGAAKDSIDKEVSAAKPKRKWPKKLPKADRYKTYKQYPIEDMKKALDKINEGMSVKEAAELYNIPKKTLAGKLRNNDVLIDKTTTTVSPIGPKAMKGKISKFIPKPRSEIKIIGLEKSKTHRPKREINLETKGNIKRGLHLNTQRASKHVSVEQVRSKYKAVVKANFKTKTDEQEVNKTDANEMNKHRDNIMSILHNSNATLIKGYWVSSYHCNFCDEQTSNPAQLKEHNLKSHKDISEPIKVKYVSELVLRLDITGLTCNVCGKSIDTLETLMTHLKSAHDVTIHNDIKNHMIPFKFDSEDIKCVICKKEYKYFKLLSEHMSEHYRNYECPVCDRSFINKQSMQTHTYRHKSGVFKCSQCPKVFDTRPKKSCHERLVHTLANKTRKCSYCDEKFSTKDLVKSHEVRVHGVEPTIYSCQACNKTYTSESSLMTHRKRFHLMLRPHKCSYCEMAFFSQVELRSHIVTHTKTREFQCQMCTKRFGTKCSLNQHVRGHLDDRRYKCLNCERAFVHRTAWKVHMRTKHASIV